LLFTAVFVSRAGEVMGSLILPFFVLCVSGWFSVFGFEAFAG
jgi:hypothetical protein